MIKEVNSLKIISDKYVEHFTFNKFFKKYILTNCAIIIIISITMYAHIGLLDTFKAIYDIGSIKINVNDSYIWNDFILPVACIAVTAGVAIVFHTVMSKKNLRNIGV